MSSENEPISSCKAVLGKKLRLFCEGKSSVKDVAEALKIKPQQLQKYVRGEQRPGSEVLAGLKRLGCDVGWLVDDEEPIGFSARPTVASLANNDPVTPLAFPAAQALLGLPLETYAPQLEATPHQVNAWAEGIAFPTIQQLALLFNLVVVAGVARVDAHGALVSRPSISPDQRRQGNE